MDPVGAGARNRTASVTKSTNLAVGTAVGTALGGAAGGAVGAATAEVVSRLAPNFGLHNQNIAATTTQGNEEQQRQASVSGSVNFMVQLARSISKFVEEGVRVALGAADKMVNGADSNGKNGTKGGCQNCGGQQLAQNDTPPPDTDDSDSESSTGDS